jgi:hypothetical protein
MFFSINQAGLALQNAGHYVEYTLNIVFGRFVLNNANSSATILSSQA